jgi:hypothetical protein
MQTYNWELSNQWAWISPQTEILNSLLNLYYACACESFLKRIWCSLIWFKTTEFYKREKYSMLDQSKVKPYIAIA